MRIIHPHISPLLPAAFALLLFFSGCYSAAQNQSAPPGMASGGMPINTLTLHKTTVRQSADYQAKLISRHSVFLQPQVSGQIMAIYVKAGDRVAAGSLLILIDPRKQQASLHSSQADAAALKAAVKQSEDTLQTLSVQRKALLSSVDYNQKQFNRYQALFKKGSASRQDMEKSRDSLNKAEADLEANMAQLQAQHSAIVTSRKTYERALAGVREETVQLQYYRITAPYAGIVGDIPVKIGNMVTTNTQLLSITENNPLELNVGLPTEKAFSIKNGLPVDVLDNQDHPVRHSVISFVSPIVDTGTQTILAKAVLQNPDSLLKAEQSVKARVIYSHEPGFLIPTSVVAHLGGQDFVFTVHPKGKQYFVKQQPVTLGNLQDNQYIVLKGVGEGDVIVSDGIQKLTDNAPVMPMPHTPAASDRSGQGK